METQTQTPVVTAKVTAVDRHLASVLTFVTDPLVNSAPFSHSQLAQLTGCPWTGSVTLVSALRGQGHEIHRVGKTPVVREGVDIDKQAPAEMEEENTFILFPNSIAYAEYEAQVEAAAEAEREAHRAANAAAAEQKRMQRHAETARKNALAAAARAQTRADKMAAEAKRLLEEALKL